MTQSSSDAISSNNVTPQPILDEVCAKTCDMVTESDAFTKESADSICRTFNSLRENIKTSDVLTALAGATYQAIAEQLGYANAKGAHKAVASAMKLTLCEPAEELRELEVARLDAMLLALWRRVQSGDEKAIDRALKIAERRAKLLGLDAPQRLEQAGPEGGPVQHEYCYDFSNLSDEDLMREIQETLAESGQPPLWGEPGEDEQAETGGSE